MSKPLDLETQRPYALDQLTQLQSQIIQSAQGMVVQRARIEKYRQSDLVAARDTYTELEQIRRNLTEQIMPEEDIYTVLAAKVQGGMSGSNTLVNLETPEKKQTYAYVRGGRPELAPGTQLSHVKLTTRKQDTVVFCVLESYEVYQQGQQAA